MSLPENALNPPAMTKQETQEAVLRHMIARLVEGAPVRAVMGIAFSISGSSEHYLGLGCDPMMIYAIDIFLEQLERSTGVRYAVQKEPTRQIVGECGSGVGDQQG